MYYLPRYSSLLFSNHPKKTRSRFTRFRAECAYTKRCIHSCFYHHLGDGGIDVSAVRSKSEVHGFSILQFLSLSVQPFYYHFAGTIGNASWSYSSCRSIEQFFLW